MSALASLTPIWIAFEVIQLVVSERFLGVKHIQAGIDPRRTSPSEWLAFLWSASLFLYWGWMVAMLYTRIGTAQVLALIAISIVGYVCRRVSTLKWILVLLTFEGAIRIGMLVSLTALVWRRG